MRCFGRVDQPALYKSDLNRAVRVTHQIGIFLGASGWHQLQRDTAFGKKILVTFAVFAVGAAFGTGGDNERFRWRVNDEQGGHGRDDDRKYRKNDQPVLFDMGEEAFHGANSNR